MADENQIGIEANLQQPVDQLTKLEQKLATVLKATKSLSDQFAVLADSKVGTAHTKAFDAAHKELLKSVSTTFNLVKNENLGARIGKLTVDGMAAGIKANQTTYSRAVTDAIISTFKDAERLTANSPILKLLQNQNSGATRFSQSAAANLDRGQTLTEERRLELAQRIRAAELLVASAKAESERRGDSALTAIIGKRETELRQLRAVQTLVEQQTAALQRQQGIQENITRSFQRRAALIETQTSRSVVSSVGTQSAIDQIAGVTPDQDKVLGRMRAYYTDLAEKKANIAASANAVAEAKIAAADARRAAGRSMLDGSDRARQEELRRASQVSENNYQQAVAKSQQDLQRLRLFGDGGQFLLEIQARLMLNYKVLTGFLSAVTYGVTSVVQFDEALHQLQAIAGATGGEMVKLKEVIVSIAEVSRYSSVELTKAAVTLAQAGLSPTQIGAALKPITLLAQSTGSELKTSVEVVTSVLGAFNYRAEETGQIVNIMAGALNNSKLDMEKLALGIQYAGNTAAQSNISFSELTTVISALSNTGVRSGSTLGTGVTQIIADLLNPTDKLKASLRSVGLTLADVDIRSKGFIPVLKAMADAGFGAAQAFEGFELRGARAYLGLLSQVDGLAGMQRQIITATSAVDGSRVAMNSLSATSDQLKANFGVLSDKMGESLVPQVTAVLRLMTDLLKSISGMGATVGSLAVTVGGWAIFALLGTTVLRAAAAIGTTAVTLAGFTRGLAASSAAGYGFSASMGLAAGSAARFATTMTVLRAVAVPALIFGAFELLSMAVSKTDDSTVKYRESLDKAKGSTNEATQAVNKQVESQQAIDKQIGELLSKYSSLNSNSEALANTTLDLKTRFSDLGLSLPDTVTNVNQLIEALTKLRQISQDEQLTNLGKKISGAQGEAQVNRDRLTQLRDKTDLDQYLRNSGGSFGPVARALGPGRFTGPGVPSPNMGLAQYSIENGQGSIAEVKDLMKAFNDETPWNLLRLRAIGEKKLQELKAMKNQDTPLNKNDMFTPRMNATILEAVIARSQAIVEAMVGENNAKAMAADAKGSADKMIELRKPIYESINLVIQQTEIRLAQMRDKLKTAPVGEQRNISSQMQATATEMKLVVDEAFNDYLATLTEEQKVIARQVFANTSGRNLQSSLGTVNSNVEQSNIEVNKYQEIRLQTEKRTIELRIATLKKQAALYNDELRVSQYNSQILAEYDSLHGVQEKLNRKKLDTLVGEKLAAERESLLQQQAAEMAAQTESQREYIYASMIRVSQEKVKAETANAQATIRSINATISADMTQLSGLVGRGMSKEARDRILAQVSNLIEQMISIQIKMLISSLEAQGKNPDDPEYRPQFESIIETGRQTLERHKSTFNNQNAGAGQAELSREMKQLLADIGVRLQKLSQLFKDIERGLDNAMRAADNIQAEFDYSQKSFDAPQNRARFSSSFKDVEEFNNRYKVEEEVRLKRIEAQKSNLQQSMSGQEQAKREVDTLTQQRDALERVAQGNTANNTALAAVKEKLQSAQGEYEKYTSNVEKSAIALDKLNLEQRKMTEVKTSPGLFTTLETAYQSWSQKNGLFKDEIAQIGDRVPAILDTISGSMSTMFMDIAEGTKTAGQAFVDMGKTIIKAILQVIVQMIAMKMVQSAMSFFGFSFAAGGSVGGGSGAGGITTSVLPVMSPGNQASGGAVRRMAGGGMFNDMFGPAANRDSVPTMLMPGEYVLRRAAAQGIGRKALDDMNMMGNRNINPPSIRNPQENVATPNGGGIVNVWIVPPNEQAPPPSAKDIVAIVSKDMMNGGQTRQLIRQIQMGQVA